MSNSSSSNNNNNKKKIEFLKSIFFKANAGCGCSCGKPKLCDVIEPIPIPKTKTKTLQNPHLLPSSSSSVDDHDHDDDSGLMVETCRSSTESVLKDSIAVVKDSEDPFEDFKQSMKQMIMEKQIYSDEDLRALLKCFLELNSPLHHDIIIRAFAEISISIFQDDHHEPSNHS